MEKTVLLLGSGMCSRPIIHYLDSKGYTVIVGSRRVETAEEKIKGTKNCKAITLDIETKEGKDTLASYCPKVSAVISLLPYIYHPIAAEIAIDNDTHFLTASYVKPAMTALGKKAEKKGIIVINECGVDPGTDHMSAMKIIDRVHKEKGKLVFFTSYAGGLPNPATNDNPFGYKFSWSPKGVLLAGKNSASFLRQGEVEDIDGEELFKKYWSFHVEGFEKMEVYPNRDSTPYAKIYKIPEVKTLIRGTLRNKGWCHKIKKLVDLGYVEEEETTFVKGASFASVTAGLVGAPDGAKDLATLTAKFLGIAEDHETIKAFEWLGLFSTEELVDAKATTRIDALCILMRKKMTLPANEKDLMLLRHTMQAVFEDRIEHITSTLVDYGFENGDTSMARTTSLPLAIAVRLVVEGKFKKTGLSIPTIPELYNPILKELAVLGIKYTENICIENRPFLSPEDVNHLETVYLDSYSKAYNKKLKELIKK